MTNTDNRRLTHGIPTPSFLPGATALPVGDPIQEQPRRMNAIPAKTIMRSEVLTDFAQLERLESDWDRLWSTNPRREIFGKFAWVRAWWRAYGRRRSLCTPVAFSGDRAVGILPVAAEGRTLRFLGTPGADYNDLLCEPSAGVEALESLLQALCDLRMPWDHCYLEQIPETAQIMAPLRLLSERLRSRMELVFRTSCPSVTLEGNRSEVLSAILNKKGLRQQQNNLRKRGKLTFRHLEDPGEIKSHLPLFFQQHIARWAMTGSRSIFFHEETRIFYYALVEELDPRAELRFSVLELDGRPIAYHLGFELQGKFVYYKPTFDIDLWKESPGGLLLKHLFEYVAEKEIREFDFTVGNEAYKDRFANSYTRKNYDLYLYRAGPRGRTLHFCMRAKERLRRSPRLFLGIKAIVTGARNTSGRFGLALRQHGAFALGRKLMTQVFRAAVFDHNEMLVFSCDKKGLAVTDAEPNLRPGTLTELVNLSVEDSGLVNVPSLHRARERLNHGDRVYFAQGEGNVIHLVWMGVRDRGISLDGYSECRIELNEPVSVVFDCQTIPTTLSQDIPPRILQQLVALAPEDCRQMWICCQNGDVGTRGSIEKAGFQLRFRVRRIQVLHWFMRTWVE